MEIKLKKINELFCKAYDKLNMKSMCVEFFYEILVEELKVNICRCIFMNQEKESLEAEDTRKEVDREHALDIRDECLAESEEDSESK